MSHALSLEGSNLEREEPVLLATLAGDLVITGPSRKVEPLTIPGEVKGRVLALAACKDLLMVVYASQAVCYSIRPQTLIVLKSERLDPGDYLSSSSDFFPNSTKAFFAMKDQVLLLTL